MSRDAEASRSSIEVLKGIDDAFRFPGARIGRLVFTGVEDGRQAVWRKSGMVIATEETLQATVPGNNNDAEVAKWLIAEAGRVSGHPIDEITGHKRQAGLVRPRQAAMFAIRKNTELSYPQIAELFGGRDHTTVIHADRKVSRAIEEENPTGATRALVDDVKALEGSLKESIFVRGPTGLQLFSVTVDGLYQYDGLDMDERTANRFDGLPAGTPLHDWDSRRTSPELIETYGGRVLDLLSIGSAPMIEQPGPVAPRSAGQGQLPFVVAVQ